MHPLQQSSDIVIWAGKNTAHNLKFIPDDKLDWEPAEGAKSALEICAEIFTTVGFFYHALKDEDAEFHPVSFATREEAQVALEGLTAEFAQFLLSLDEAELKKEKTLACIGTVTKERIVLMSVVECCHHHGQITYIQSLLGDTDSHFYEMGT